MRRITSKTALALLIVVVLIIAGASIIHSKKVAMESIPPAKTYGMVVQVRTASVGEIMQLQELFDFGLKFHGHKCPAMPLGIKSGLAAMRVLGVDRARDKELFVAAETGNAVRVSLKPDFFEMALNSPFVQQRKAGVPPQDIEPEITDPLVNRTLGLKDEDFLDVGEIHQVIVQKGKGLYEAKRCAVCGELTFINKLRETGDGNLICIPCSGQAG